MEIKVWLSAFRLRTLPLALSSIGMGSALAVQYNSFDGLIFAFAVLTTVLLQILSNLANDYGDFTHGADSKDRVGPTRALQSGKISAGAMKKGIILFGVLSFISGITLLLISLSMSVELLIMLCIGLVAIVAAVNYTAGKSPYGYSGLGDVSVFLFFGLTGVLGSFYLYTQQVYLVGILPALSIGFFSAGVLNVNNMRDIDSDTPAGKMTIPVKIGIKHSKYYHIFLIVSGLLSIIMYSLLTSTSLWQYLHLLVFPLFINHLIKVFSVSEKRNLDPFLKQLALATFILVLLFGMGTFLSSLFQNTY